MKTEVTELLGIEYPIIQGGMAWVAEYHLAAGVSNAGGLGLIGAASAPAEWVREQIRSARKLTDRPFGVNIMLMSPYADEVAKVIVEEGVKVVTTGAGSPEKYMDAWKAAGVKVIPVVASVALARRMERCGADAVVAEGSESGGHIGETTTMALVPQVVDAEKNDTRVVMHLHPALAPFKACVLPLSKKLSEEASALYAELSEHFMVDYDEAGSIGKRYRRQDEIGTPFCITYDFESKEDGCVTVRDRDTMQQERIPMKDLTHYIIKKLKF